jgi:hypothetical protein
MKKLIWTMKDDTLSFPPDELLYNFSASLPDRDLQRRTYFLDNLFCIERFGNSARVYIVTGPQPNQIKCVGIFTWGMSKHEAQKYA